LRYVEQSGESPLQGRRMIGITHFFGALNRRSRRPHLRMQLVPGAHKFVNRWDGTSCFFSGVNIYYTIGRYLQLVPAGRLWASVTNGGFPPASPLLGRTLNDG
jgi:hypothetical protein